MRYTEAQSQQFFDQVAERARAVPGVKTVTMTTSVPMSNDSIGFETSRAGRISVSAREGQRHGARGERRRTLLRHDGPHAASGPQLHASTMHSTAPRVAIVNQQFAQHYWPNQDPIGKRFRRSATRRTWVQVVGLAKTSKYIFIAEPPTEFVYFPYRQKKPPRDDAARPVRGRPGALAAPLREVVRGLDANMPIYNVRTMEQLYRMRAISIFKSSSPRSRRWALMGLGLAIVGLYGLVAYAASPAHARDRHPHGDRRRPRRGAADGAAAGGRAGRRRSAGRPRWPASAPASCCGRRSLATISGTVGRC